MSSGILALALQYTQRALGLPLLLVTLGTGRVTWVREEHGFSGPTKLEHLNRSPRSDPHPHKGLRRGGLWGQPGDTEEAALCLRRILPLIPFSRAAPRQNIPNLTQVFETKLCTGFCVFNWKHNTTRDICLRFEDRLKTLRHAGRSDVQAGERLRLPRGRGAAGGSVAL